VFGIDLFVHFTFLILLAFIVFAQYSATQSWALAGLEVLFILLVFGIVVLHELGHALAARQFGVRTRDITLLPIGGVARLERIPENPFQEFVIAVAGPAVNVVLAAGCFLWLVATGDLSSWVARNLGDPGFVERLLMVNIGLVVFNMIPAFPMDGGRVLRSILAMGLDYVHATNIAATIGQGIAVLMGIFALLQGWPILALVAFFIWMGAAQEARFVATRASVAGIPVRRAMISAFQVAEAQTPLAAVAQSILQGFQQDFPVVEEDRVIGILSRHDLLKALPTSDPSVSVADVMQRQFASIGPDEPLSDAIQKLQECEGRALPVLAGGRLVGLLTAEKLSEFLLVQSAAQQRRAQPALPLATPSRAT
jgi:Zn-dependent protease